MENNPTQHITEEVAMTTLQERVQEMLKALGVSQVEFGKLAGASRGLVHQWVKGQTLNMGARFANKLEGSTGYRSRWIMFGVGDKKQDESIAKVAALMEMMSEDDRIRLLQIAEGWAKPVVEREVPATALTRRRPKYKTRRA